MSVDTETAVTTARASWLTRLLDRAAEFALAQPRRRVITTLVVGIGLMAILGTFQRLGWGFSLFDFDGEGKPPAAWSALVLASGGVLGILVGRRGSEPARRFTVFGSFLIFMSLDEAIEFHERAQSLLHVDWQKLWAPFILIGAIAWCYVLRRLWPMARERAMLLTGAAFWLISQIDERYQSNHASGRVKGYGALSGVEEILEVSGSALFLLAMLGALHAARGRAGRPASD